MKKILLSLVLCCSALMLPLSGLHAQNFKSSGKSISELFPEQSGKVVTVEGDINKDGIKDLIVAFTEYWVSGDNFAFYFGNRQGGYSLFRAYDIQIFNNTEITITDKGVVRFQTDIPDGFDVFLFRFQDGDFHLIGSKQDRHKSEHYDISYNYLTGQMIRVDGEGAKKTSQTLKMPKMPSLKFGWFPLSMDEMDYLFVEDTHDSQVQEKTLMGIFKLMLEHGIIYPTLWYNENNLALDADNLSVWMEYMSFGCYNYLSDISIGNNGDETYSIVIHDVFEDRSYERNLNDDMSNWDELEEQMEQAEVIATDKEYLFKEGNFILIKETRFRNTHDDVWEPIDD